MLFIVKGFAGWPGCATFSRAKPYGASPRLPAQHTLAAASPVSTPLGLPICMNDRQLCGLPVSSPSSNPLSRISAPAGQPTPHPRTACLPAPGPEQDPVSRMKKKEATTWCCEEWLSWPGPPPRFSPNWKAPFQPVIPSPCLLFFLSPKILNMGRCSCRAPVLLPPWLPCPILLHALCCAE